jgi:hypothetical protein
MERSSMPKLSVVAIPVRDEAERIGGCLAAFTRQVVPADHIVLHQAKRNAVAAHASQYSTLIGDSPNGFRLPPELLSVFERPYEVFLAHE